MEINLARVREGAGLDLLEKSRQKVRLIPRQGYPDVLRESLTEDFGLRQQKCKFASFRQVSTRCMEAA